MMNDYKFNKLLSDTITLPILPANKFTNTDTEYYAVLEKNYIPIESSITCIYKPDWIKTYKFTIEDKYYNRLSITSINDNSEKKMRKGIMEFVTSNNIVDDPSNPSFISSINHIYAKVSQAPYEEVDVRLEFIPTENQKELNNKEIWDDKKEHIIGGTITGDEQELHLKYYGILNGVNQSNVTLKINGKSLDQIKIKSLKINTSDNSVELIYLIDENIDPLKNIIFTVTFNTQYNNAQTSKTITQLQNKYNISLTINNIDNVVYTGDKRILFYSCNINGKKEIESDVNLEFTYITNENELRYVIQSTTYANKQFNTIINVEKNYTTEIRKVKVKATYNINDIKKIESNEIVISQDNTNIVIQYYLEYLDRGTKENVTSDGNYTIEPFGETVRIHYYGLVNGDKITSVTNTKNGITNTYNLFAYDRTNNNAYFTNILNNDEYIFDITFSRNEQYETFKLIFMGFIGLKIADAYCKLTQNPLSINLELNKNKSTSEIGGIPEFNNIILTFRAYDTTREETVDDINLYTIISDNTLVDLSDIQYEIITYDNIKYVVASNIRSKNIYFNKNKDSRILQFTIKYNNKTVVWTVNQKSVIYGCEIKVSTNVVSSMGDDNFQVKCIGIINDNYTTNKLETNTDRQYLVNNKNGKENVDKPTYVEIFNTVKGLNYSTVYLKLQASNGAERIFYIKSIYKDIEATCEIKQLALSVCVELYKDQNYLYKIDYEENKDKKIIISPFIDNYIYFKCYLYEISYDEDGKYKPINIDVREKKYAVEISSNFKNIPEVAKPIIKLNNITYTSDYTYQGVLCIPKFICRDEIEYDFIYKQEYYTYKDNKNNEKTIDLRKDINIYKPQVYTLTSNNKPYEGTICIQYRSDSPSNIKQTEILKFEDVSNIMNTYSLYYRVVYAFNSTSGLYIYKIGQYDTYIDTDYSHFKEIINSQIDGIPKLNWKPDNFIELSSNELFGDNKQEFLKSTFNILENNNLQNKGIMFDINYQYDDYNNIITFKKDTLDEYNHVEIIQRHGDIECDYYFDDNNDGIITTDKHKITYTPIPHEYYQYFYFNIKINDNITDLNINNFIIDNDNNNVDNIDITQPIAIENTRRSSYLLNKIYTENINTTYYIYYQYKDGDTVVDNTKYGPLIIERQSFAENNDSKLYIEINNDSKGVNVSNNGEIVTISFWIEYKGNKVDLGSEARKNFSLLWDEGSEQKINTSLIPKDNIISYNDKTYSFEYYINPNNNTNNKTYKFTVNFGEKFPVNQYVYANQSGSLYRLNATVNIKSLNPLNPNNVTVSCNVVKDDNEEVYTNGITQEKFSITPDNDQITEVSILYSGGIYSKIYKFNDNKNPEQKTYTFTCKYDNIYGNVLINDVDVIQEGATFDVSIEDSEQSSDKKNIVNPVGGSKIINYWGILNNISVIDDVQFVNDTVSDGLSFVSEDVDYGIKKDEQNKKLSRKFNFKLNTTPNTIIYKFTAKYQNNAKSIEFTQLPGEITLVLSNVPDPIPKQGGNCKLIYYAYAGNDKNSNHIIDNITLNNPTDVDGYMSYTYTKVSGPTVTNNQIEYVFNVPARVEDINIDKLFKKNWSITYKNGDIEKTLNKDITQNGDVEFFPSFDIFGLVYEWVGGHDLDTATLLTRSDGGELLIDASVDICKNSFGWSQINNTKNSHVYDYIAFSGDNTYDCGYESIAINFKKLLLDFNLSKININLNFDIWMHWFGSKWDGKVNINFVRYNDIKFQTINNNEGNIKFIPKEPFNPLASCLYLLDPSINQLDTTNSSISITTKSTIVDAKGNYSTYNTTYAKVGRLQYNTKTKTAELSINKYSYGPTRCSENQNFKYKLEINVDNKYTDIKFGDSYYNLYNIVSISNNIQNGTNITMKLLYRDSSVSTPYQKNMQYVDCSISEIYLYTDSSHVNKTMLTKNNSYYNTVLDKSKYMPTNHDINKFYIPSIDINNISNPPTTIDSKTYYGLQSLTIQYCYSYNSNASTFFFNREIKAEIKL